MGVKERKGKRNSSIKGKDSRHRRRHGEEKEIHYLEEQIKLLDPSDKQSSTKLFSELPISYKTKQGLAASKFVTMTDIQKSAIPHALRGRDVLGEARTGSGKTLAFLVPVVELLYRQRWTQMDGLGALCVSPTRELAYQIFQVLKGIGTEHDFSAGCVVGGRDLQDEQKTLMGISILVATPGRLLQHLDESVGFSASSLQILVFDEADRILDFGFQETVHHILAQLPTERQTLLFSATLHTSVHRLGQAALRSPELISVHRDASSRTPDKLKQVYMVVPLEQKIDTLFSFLRSHSQKKMIVFVSACKQVRYLYEAFRKLKPGPAVLEFHGKQSLMKRMVVFEEFSEKERAAALICTDIAARGVDFPAVDWVVQMDCPDAVDTYIHRVGRTARFESKGNSLLFLLPSESSFAAKLTAARISIQNISAKQGKMISVKPKLFSLLAGDGAVKHLAQKAFISYIRSIHLMKDKELFKVDALPQDAFAESLGLASAPPVGIDTGIDVDGNPVKKMKNKSALQRLKEKIKAKKSITKQSQSVTDSTADHGNKEQQEDESMEDTDSEPTKTKKLSRWERRQKRIAKLGQIQAATAKGENMRQNADDNADPVDDLLQLAEEPHDVPKLVRAPKRKHLKLRKDGTTQDLQRKHVVFNENGVAASGDLGLIAEELQDGSPSSVKNNASSRKSFIKQVASDLAGRDTFDAMASRARIHELHVKQRRRAKQDADSDDGADEAQVVLGGGSSPSASPSPARRPTKKRRKAEDAATSQQLSSQMKENHAPQRTNERIPQKPRLQTSPTQEASGDGLVDFEQEVLRKLGGSSLFS